MNFELTEDQGVIRGMVRDLARAGAPTVKSLGELGLMGIMAPEKIGGSGMGLVDACVILEELAARHPSTARTVQIHNTLALGALLEAGTEAQQAEWAERLATGAALGSFGATPDGSRVNGVAHGETADVVVVLGADGFALMTGGAPLCPPAGILGFRELRKCDLSGGALEPMPHDAARSIQAGNVGLSAIALGIARGALEHGCAYAQERKQFRKPISEFQAIQWKIADSAVAIDSARLLVHRAAWLHDVGKAFARQSAMARISACAAAVEVTDHAVQIHGGYGYTTDFPVESLFRDARACAAVGGTPDAQRNDVATSLLANF